MLPGNCWPGADLRLLVRSTSRLDNIAGILAEHVIGDLRDLESLKKGMADCEFVFHVAADYRLWSLNRQELYDSNVEGTRNVLRRREIPACAGLFIPAALPPWASATTAVSRTRNRR